MAKKTWIYTNGSWKEVKNVWVYGNGEWRSNSVPFVHIGSWKPTIIYDFEHNPEWITSNLVVTQTSIQFSYKNNNTVDATLEVRVEDSNDDQAMDVISTTINAGETLTFDSNDYNDLFSANQTYTFDAVFKKTHFNTSGNTINNITTSPEPTPTPITATPATNTPPASPTPITATPVTATPATATPATATPGRTDTPSISVPALKPPDTAIFTITNNDASTATIAWEIRVGGPSGTVLNSGSTSVGSGNSTSASASISASGIYCCYATAQASGETISQTAGRCETFTVGGGGL